jgi:hypothetical protein
MKGRKIKSKNEKKNTASNAHFFFCSLQHWCVMDLNVTTCDGIGHAGLVATAIWHKHAGAYDVRFRCRRFAKVEEFFQDRDTRPESDILSVATSIDLNCNASMELSIFLLLQMMYMCNSYGTQVSEAPDGTICILGQGVTILHGQRTVVSQNNNAECDVLLRNAPTSTIVRWVDGYDFEILDAHRDHVLPLRRRTWGTICCDATTNGSSSVLALTTNGEIVDVQHGRAIHRFSGRYQYYRFMDDGETMIIEKGHGPTCTVYDSRSPNFATRLLVGRHVPNMTYVAGGANHVLLQFDSPDTYPNSELVIFDVRRSSFPCGSRYIRCKNIGDHVFVNWSHQDPFAFSCTVQDFIYPSTYCKDHF